MLRQIKSVHEWYDGQRIALPDAAALYAFWWLGPKEQLLSANTSIRLYGPNRKLVEVEYHDWWPTDVEPCLYIGKTTRLRKRFGLHLKRGTQGRVHKRPCQENIKVTPKTTSCQLRHGIEHIFPDEEEPLSLILRNVGFSFYLSTGENSFAERFFEEDRLIGHFRPWFNIDSER